MTEAYDEIESPFSGRDRSQTIVDIFPEQHLSYIGSGASFHCGALQLRMQDGQSAVPVDGKRLEKQLRAKRALVDIPLASLALLALLPLLVVVALLIKLTSPGPVMFRQTRVGHHGREFGILKFRSMRYDLSDHSGVQQTERNDGRVTPIGKFIRASSIDELPQLWNILVGDMSVVGPRPMVGGQLAGGVPYKEAVPYYDYRHQVRPGLSGWAQVNGLRGPTTDSSLAKRRIDYDCAYVQNLSLRLDFQIIVETIRREFLTGSGS